MSETPEDDEAKARLAPHEFGNALGTLLTNLEILHEMLCASDAVDAATLAVCQQSVAYALTAARKVVDHHRDEPGAEGPSDR